MSKAHSNTFMTEIQSKDNNNDLPFINKDGTKFWIVNGAYHRDDKPAIEYTDGSYEYYKHGILHREDGKLNTGVIFAGTSTASPGPAIVHIGKFQEWRYNGMRHRIDGPALIYSTGCQEWWHHNIFIKREWIHNGYLHNNHGPAIVHNNGCQEWWFHGVFDRMEWTHDGVLHNEYGPAVIYANGLIKCYLYGKLHRNDGPAIFLEGEICEWYLNGKLHRKDGPAVFNRSFGSKFIELWYINGNRILAPKY